MAAEDDLIRGRDACQRLAWAEAHSTLSAAAESRSLAGEDLELMACAAYLLGRIDECHQALRRAQQAYVADGRRTLANLGANPDRDRADLPETRQLFAGLPAVAIARGCR
jgi:hypothetical protein